MNIASGGFNLCVTSMGMVSSLGLDVVTSCAAARAGITRANELDGLELLDPETGELERVKGHAVFGLTDGYWGLGRAVRLGLGGVRDIITSTNISDWSRIGLFINLPSGFYTVEAERVVKSNLEPSNNNDEDALSVVEYRNGKLREQLIPTIAKLAGISIKPSNQRVFFGDQTGVIPVLHEAAQRLQDGQLQCAVVGGIDSRVEPESLETFNRLGLLKTPSMAAGFIPGEMAAFVLLEPEDMGSRHGSHDSVVIEALSDSSEQFNHFSDDPAVGIALSSTIAVTLNLLEDKGRQTGLIIGDLNGDPYRAYDWGHALIRLKVTHHWIALPEWYPALSFGDIGAATGFADICLVTTGFMRRYAGTNNVLAWLSNDDGKRGSFYIRKHASLSNGA